MTRIIYKQDNGRVAIIHPCTWETNPATGEKFSVEEVAAMTVPNGKKLYIVSVYMDDQFGDLSVDGVVIIISF